MTPPTKDFFESLRTTESGQDFLKRALVIDPRKRASTDELLRHTFLKVGYCPDVLSELAFDVPPTFESDEKRAADEGAGVDDGRQGKKAKIADSQEKAETGREEAETGQKETETGQERAARRMEEELAEFKKAKLAYIQEVKAVKNKGLALDLRKGDLKYKYGSNLSLLVKSSGGTEY